MAEDSNNMEIARYHRQVKQDPSAGNFIATPSNTYAADQQLFNTITQTALAIEAVDEKIRVAEANDQLASASIQSDQAFEELRNSLDPNNTEDWAEKEGEFYKTRLEEIGGQIKSKYARDEWPLRVEAKKAQYGRILGSQKRSVLARNFQENHRNMSASAMSMSWDMPDYQEFNIFTADKMEVLHGLQLKEGHEGDRELKIENFERVDEEKENPMFPDEKLRFSSGEIYLEGSKKGFNKKQVENFKDFMVEIALKSDDGMERLNHLRAKDYKDIGLTNDDLDDIKRDYKTARNDIQSQITSEQKAKAEAVEMEITNDIQKAADPKVPLEGKLTIDQIRKKIRKANEEGIFISAEQPRVLGNYLDSKTNGRAENDPQALAEAYKMMTTDMTQQQKFNKLTSLSSKLESNTVDGFVKDIYKPETVSNATYSAYSKAITSLRTGNMFSGNIVKNINLSLKAQDLLRMFAEENPDADEKEYEKFFNKLVENQARWWAIVPGGRPWSPLYTRFGETRASIPKNIESIQKELGTTGRKKPSQYKTGDTRTINGVTYTYDGQYWKD